MHSPSHFVKLHPAVSMALVQSRFLASLAEQFPDAFRLMNEYCELMSCVLSDEEVSVRMLKLTCLVDDDTVLAQGMPCKKQYENFAKALTRDVCAFGGLKMPDDDLSAEEGGEHPGASALRAWARKRTAGCA